MTISNSGAPPWSSSRSATAGTVAPDAWHATRAQTSLSTQIARDKDDYLATEKDDVGRSTGPNERELFVSCDAGPALQQQFEHLRPEFIVVHDIGTASSRKLLSGIGAASGRALQKLVIRRQGYGKALGTLFFIELPAAGGLALRMYTTESEADPPTRVALARMLLAFSRLGVVMVGDLTTEALRPALKALREDIIAGPWHNRNLLLLPLASASNLVAQGMDLAQRTGVNVRTTPVVARPAEAWGFISDTWRRLSGQDGAETSTGSPAAAALAPELPVFRTPPPPARPPSPAPPVVPTLHVNGAAKAWPERAPDLAASSRFESSFGPESGSGPLSVAPSAPARAAVPLRAAPNIPAPAPAPAPALSTATAAPAPARASAAAPAPARAPAIAPSITAANAQAGAPSIARANALPSAAPSAAPSQPPRAPTLAPVPAPPPAVSLRSLPPSARASEYRAAAPTMPMELSEHTRPANPPQLQVQPKRVDQNILPRYVRLLSALNGMTSCCVFDVATGNKLAHAGSTPGATELGRQGQALMGAMLDASEVLGCGHTLPEAAITLDTHHLLLRQVPRHPGLALHAVFDKGTANLTLARLQVLRLDALFEEAPRGA